MPVVEATESWIVVHTATENCTVKKAAAGALSLVAFSIGMLECRTQPVSLRELPAVLTLNHFFNTFYQDRRDPEALLQAGVPASRRRVSRHLAKPPAVMFSAD